VTLTPVADTMARQASPTSNFGAVTPLGSDSEDVAGNAATRVTAYLKFTLPALAAGESITDASLSLFVSGTTANGPKVFPTTTTWTETGLTWSSPPTRTASTPVGDFGAMSTLNARSSTAITSLPGGDVSFELFADATDGLDFAAKEDANAANRPQLVLTIRSG
jgi:hypothetical protein